MLNSQEEIELKDMQDYFALVSLMGEPCLPVVYPIASPHFYFGKGGRAESLVPPDPPLPTPSTLM